MKNTQIRRLFCVLLVLCLLCSCIAVPAFATEAALFAVKSVTASLAMDGLIRGLGVLPVDSESGAFGTLVNNCVSYVESVSDFIVDGVCKVAGVRTGDGFSSYLPIGVAQLVWEWLYSDASGPVITSGSFNEVTTYECGNYSGALAYAAGCRYAYKGTYTQRGSFGSVLGTYDCVLISNFNTGITITDGNLVADARQHGYCAFIDNGTNTRFGAYNTGTFGLTNASVIASSPVPETTSNVVLGDTQSPFYGVSTPIMLPDAPVYAPWTEHTYSIPSYSNQDEFVSGLPVSIPDSSSSALTQSQAQAGTNSLDWAQTDTESDGVTLANILSAITSLPVKLVSTVTQGIANFFGITGTADSYAISLKDFFPFCIPFDLYDFFTVLSAPPEAPVIEWEIPAPKFGGPYQLEVDLSAWDDIAVLFRTFELLAFIVGLALITREKFLRS